MNPTNRTYFKVTLDVEAGHGVNTMSVEDQNDAESGKEVDHASNSPQNFRGSHRGDYKGKKRRGTGGKLQEGTVEERLETAKIMAAAFERAIVKAASKEVGSSVQTCTPQNEDIQNDADMERIMKAMKRARVAEVNLTNMRASDTSSPDMLSMQEKVLEMMKENIESC